MKIAMNEELIVTYYPRKVNLLNKEKIQNIYVQM